MMRMDIELSSCKLAASVAEAPFERIFMSRLKPRPTKLIRQSMLAGRDL